MIYSVIYLAVSTYYDLSIKIHHIYILICLYCVPCHPVRLHKFRESKDSPPKPTGSYLVSCNPRILWKNSPPAKQETRLRSSVKKSSYINMRVLEPNKPPSHLNFQVFSFSISFGISTSWCNDKPYPPRPVNTGPPGPLKKSIPPPRYKLEARQGKHNFGTSGEREKPLKKDGKCPFLRCIRQYTYVYIC